MAKTHHGTPCYHCGSTERYVSNNQCMRCKRSESRQRYRLHREQIRETQRNYYERTRERRLERAKRYYHLNRVQVMGTVHKWQQANPERRREISRASAKRAYHADPAKHYERQKTWRAANPEKYRALSRRWASNNPERRRELHRESARREYALNREKRVATNLRWRSANPDKILAATARRRVRSKSATPMWLKQAGQLDAINNLYASAIAAKQHIDHDIPLAGCRVCGAHGLHVLANLQAIEPSINIRKSNRCMSCFLSEMDS